jgi:hypothetical protein
MNVVNFKLALNRYIRGSQREAIALAAFAVGNYGESVRRFREAREYFYLAMDCLGDTKYFFEALQARTHAELLAGCSEQLWLHS